MNDIVLISYTPLDAPGGVPRWNRDFVSGFPGAKHYSWWDFLKDQRASDSNIPEWEKAKLLNRWLTFTSRIWKHHTIIADGFWGEDLSERGYNVISVAHGIWSHLTKEMADAGMQPEFPAHHAVQVRHRTNHLKRGGRIVAVSDFISRQMKLQWGFESHVINNAIDLDKFRPAKDRFPRARPLIIHGVTTANKGFDHVRAVESTVDADVLLLDQAAEKLGIEKYAALAQADLVVQPSAYEGNSYFVLETLASGVPIVAYNVGLLNALSEICDRNGIECCVGAIIARSLRSPEETAKVTKFILSSVMRPHSTYNPRQVAELFSVQKFHEEWRKYLEEYDAFLKSR